MIYEGTGFGRATTGLRGRKKNALIWAMSCIAFYE
jgi:hypothetical protein